MWKCNNRYCANNDETDLGANAAIDRAEQSSAYGAMLLF